MPEPTTRHECARGQPTGSTGVCGAYVEVVVTLPVTNRYTYRVPPELADRARVGSRVLVPFGARKLTGVIVREQVLPPEGIRPVDVAEVLDDVPALSTDLVELCMWISDYYEAPLGEVMRAALPAGSGVRSRLVIGLTDEGRRAAHGEGGALPEKQRAVLARLLAGDVPASSAGKRDREAYDALAAAGLVETRDLRDRARVALRREKTARLAVPLAEAREATARAPKRYAVIEALAGGEERSLAELSREIPRARAAIRELIKDGLVIAGDREAKLDAVATAEAMAPGPPPEPTVEQAAAVEAITSALPAAIGTEDTSAATAERDAADGERARSVSAFLLHGVTGSGKTEVYLRVIAEALARGKTALVLVPEISLTPQLAARFRARFGDEVAILHSGLSEKARLGEWSRLRRGSARIAVGARSAVFAPLADIGVIVVDEEHDGSFKQDEGVRYHARDVALVRAQRAGAVCVLGSATPSLETAANAGYGGGTARYRALRLTERPTARALPSVEVIDLRTYMPDGDAMLSAPLRQAIGEALAAGDQTILFLNRRGFATFVLCRACGHSFRCENCSVSLTYHRHSDRLSCHYCNAQQRIPETCPKCKAAGTIERKGLGTEKVAEAVAEAFPEARVARLDRDVASGAKVEAVLSRVARREVDVLVGTQMVTKGHDFPGVTLVGVLCADTGLELPDFRASERTFQLLSQVAGRAGRGERAGRVLIQTYRPDVAAVATAAAHDYDAFFAAEIAERADLGYPPHGRMIAIRIDGPDSHGVAGVAQRVAQLAEALARKLADDARIEVRGPVPAPIERLRGRTRWQVWLRGTDRHALRRVARGAVATTKDQTPGAIRVALDVDPLSAM